MTRTLAWLVVLVVVLASGPRGAAAQYALPRQKAAVLTYVDVAFTIYGGCGIVSDGTVRCWGGDTYGRHGTGSAEIPATKAIGQPVGLDQVTALASGLNHTCALRDDGTVWCWGLGDRGQTGQVPSDVSLRVPTKVPGLVGVTQLTAGGDRTCALMKGKVFCFGDNGRGGVGYKGKLARKVKAATGLRDVSFVAAGGGHACAIKAGAVFCWGENAGGQLGRGTIGKGSYLPTKVKGLPKKAKAVELSAGNAHTCARLDLGQVWCWGFGTAFARVDGKANDTGKAVRMLDDAGVVGLSTGPTQATCLRLATGEVRCSGNNDRHMFDACPQDAVCPSHVVADAAFAGAVRFGHRHVCYVVARDQVRCRGDASYGALHDGRDGLQPTLAPILGP